MKIFLSTYMLIIATSCFAVETNEVVYLGEFALPKIQQDWIGKSVSTVIGDAQIAQFIIIKSVSSAPLDLHTGTIKRRLQEGFAFQDPKNDKPMDFYFDAILLMNDGRRFRIRMNGLWTCLTSPTGSGYFYTAKGMRINAADNTNAKE